MGVWMLTTLGGGHSMGNHTLDTKSRRSVVSMLVLDSFQSRILTNIVHEVAKHR